MGNAAESTVSKQQAYYARTAEHYEAMHISPDDEHGIALAAFVGLAKLKNAASILDVGAGTGRALLRLRTELQDVRLVGVEPVEELREVGYRRGITRDQLVAGDATRLPFGDDEFDFVIETGVLHHVADPAAAVAEMVRVARIGVMISDSNKFGQGSAASRRVKGIVRTLGLWDSMIRLQTKGKMAKWSEGDGEYYSYSVFDNMDQLTKKFPRLHMMNTNATAGTDLRAAAQHVMLLAMAA